MLYLGVSILCRDETMLYCTASMVNQNKTIKDRSQTRGYMLKAGLYIGRSLNSFSGVMDIAIRNISCKNEQNVKFKSIISINTNDY